LLVGSSFLLLLLTVLNWRLAQSLRDVRRRRQRITGGGGGSTYCKVPAADRPTDRLGRSVLFLAVLDPTVGHTMVVRSPFISVLCHSDRLFHWDERKT